MYMTASSSTHRERERERERNSFVLDKKGTFWLKQKLIINCIPQRTVFSMLLEKPNKKLLNITESMESLLQQAVL
jgi:hypothetical protein